jgi:hypothetical protein
MTRSSLLKRIAGLRRTHDRPTNVRRTLLDLIVHEDPALRETLNKPVMGKFVFIKEEALL